MGGLAERYNSPKSTCCIQNRAGDCTEGLVCDQSCCVSPFCWSRHVYHSPVEVAKLSSDKHLLARFSVLLRHCGIFTT